MARVTYEVRKGATLTLFVGAASGDPSTITPIAARLKAITAPGDPVPLETVASVASLTISSLVAASGAIPAGYNVTLSAAQSGALADGYYVCDMAYSSGGGTYVTDAVNVLVSDAVSLP